MSLPTVPLPDPLDRVASLKALGAWGEVRELLSETAGSDPELLLQLAEAELRTGALPEAHHRLTGLVERLAPGDSAQLRRAVNMLGAAQFELGALSDAEASFGQALALADAARDVLAIARATNNLGMIANVRGRHAEALTRYRLAVPAYQRAGSQSGLAETCHNLAITHRDLGDLEQADRYERRAIEYSREAGDERLLAMAQVGRADLAIRRGEPEVAEAGARVGARQYAAMADALGEADALRVLGVAQTARGAFPEAHLALDRAVGLADRHASALLTAEAYEARARLWRLEGNATDAKADAKIAMDRLQALGATDDWTRVASWLASGA